MRHQLSFYYFLAAVSLAMALAPRWDDISVKHTWNNVPSNWESLGPPFSNTTIDLHIVLQPQYENALVDALYDVSTPGNPKYVISNTPPYMAHIYRRSRSLSLSRHRDTMDLVNSWLKYNGIPRTSISVSHGGGWLTVAAVPVFRANEMLGASYQIYQQSGENGTRILRTLRYALPAVLQKHVQTVVPTTDFPSPRRHSVGATADIASRGQGTSSLHPSLVTPPDVSWQYRTVAYVPAATDKNSLGVVGYKNQYPSPADLKKFMNNYRTNAADAATYKVLQVNGGGYDPKNPHTEPSQNIQYTRALAYPTPLTFYSVGGSIVILPDSLLPGTGDDMLEWLKYVIDQPDVPKTITTSYGNAENGFPPDYAKALCDLFAQLGARGVSVLFPSGDDGVGKGACQARDGSGKVQFIPEFPASCPYVTSVGATMGGAKGNSREVAMDLSGGGFSNYFPRPFYQDEVVPKFLEQLGSQYADMYNAEGRGIPDISAQALKIVFMFNKIPFICSGTSPSTPISASIISLLNDYLISTNRAPLGFLNPLLYGNLRQALNDITSGANPGCGTPGFSATRGWDPVTGLGTPDFLNLQALRDLMDIF
ncbi:peptidase S8/S53 domain-containing protein [Lactarius quietus]|nr:peptidase S8/S53 domain-containing protein [Lactarius quietus]